MAKKSLENADLPTIENYFAMDNFLFLKLCKIFDFAMLENLRFSKYMGEKGNELQQKSFLKTLGINIKGKIITTNTKMPSDKQKGKSSRLDSQ